MPVSPFAASHRRPRFHSLGNAVGLDFRRRQGHTPSTPPRDRAQRSVPRLIRVERVSHQNLDATPGVSPRHDAAGASQRPRQQPYHVVRQAARRFGKVIASHVAGDLREQHRLRHQAAINHDIGQRPPRLRLSSFNSARRAESTRSSARSILRLLDASSGVTELAVHEAHEVRVHRDHAEVRAGLDVRGDAEGFVFADQRARSRSC